MDWIQALILGLVQGLAEYLPVSSSGHLEICREILKIDLPAEATLQFDVILHAATVCSTLVVLWPMFSRLCRSFFTWRKDADFYYVCKILLSCIPVGIVGVFFKDAVEDFFGNGLLTVGICLCVTAVLLAFAHYSAMKAGEKGHIAAAGKGRDISWLDAFIIGCAQAVAVLPGLSRSGTTIATGIIIGDKRSEVAQFSFFMVVLPILGEALLDIKNILSPDAVQQATVGVVPVIVGFLVSFVVGCAACKAMISLVKRGKMVWFALYCLLAGFVCLAYTFA